MNNNSETTLVIPLSTACPSGSDDKDDPLSTSQHEFTDRVENVRDSVRNLRLKRKGSKGLRTSSSSTMSTSSSSSLSASIHDDITKSTARTSISTSTDSITGTNNNGSYSSIGTPTARSSSMHDSVSMTSFFFSYGSDDSGTCIKQETDDDDDEEYMDDIEEGSSTANNTKEASITKSFDGPSQSIRKRIRPPQKRGLRGFKHDSYRISSFFCKDNEGGSDHEDDDSDDDEYLDDVEEEEEESTSNRDSTTEVTTSCHDEVNAAKDAKINGKSHVSSSKRLGVATNSNTVAKIQKPTYRHRIATKTSTTAVKEEVSYRCMIEQVQQSWDFVKSSTPNYAETIGITVFEKFFELAPSKAQSFFKFNCTNQSFKNNPLFRHHAKAVVRMIDTIVNMLDDLEIVSRQLEVLGRQHAKYFDQNGCHGDFHKYFSKYSIHFGRALLHALETVLTTKNSVNGSNCAGGWNAMVKEGWKGISIFLVTCMIRGGTSSTTTSAECGTGAGAAKVKLEVGEMKTAAITRTIAKARKSNRAAIAA